MPVNDPYFETKTFLNLLTQQFRSYLGAYWGVRRSGREGDHSPASSAMFKWERDHLGDPDIGGRMILRWIFRKWDVGVWIGTNWLRIGTCGGHL